MEGTSVRGENLPAELTSFVGRRAELLHIKELLGSNRLVTLTGIGGVGKTRLALRAARDLRRAFSDGVFFVEFAALQDPTLVAGEVVDALGIAEHSTLPPAALLTGHLRHRHTLLVLDNCEHLVEAVAALSDTLLRAAPELRVLATSRQRLMVPGEHLVPVAPLPVPDLDMASASAAASQNASVALFVQRAAAVSPGFTMNGDNQDAVIRLCRRLEGLPLAIELAAARLGVLPIADLADRTGSRFTLLTKGNRTAPQRQRTLHAAIDHSYVLCSGPERLLWARTSVFAGGFTLAAIEEVCSDLDLLPEAMLDALDGLVEKSIVVQDPNDIEPRFRMLETLREYGRVVLETGGEKDTFRRRHRDWCLGLVESAAAGWFGPQQEAWALRLRAEHSNLRAALEYSLTTAGEARIALRMAGLPWFFWLACGLINEGRVWLERGLALDREPSRDRAWALGTAGYIAVNQGDEGAAADLLSACLELGQTLQDQEVVAYATNLLGLNELIAPAPDRARRLLEDARRMYADVTLPGEYLTHLLLDLALAHLGLNELDEARELVDSMHARCEQAEESWHKSDALLGRALLRLIAAEPEKAASDLTEALRIKRFFGDALGLAFAVDLFGWTKIAQGDFVSGAELLGGASDLWSTLGAPLSGFKGLLSRRQDFEGVARRSVGDVAFDSAFALGAEQDLHELLARALGERPQVTTPHRRRAGEGPLTRREREVADLVAQGLTNKEIAGALVISQRTAEAHVQNVLVKLGVSSRAHVMAWVADQESRD